VRAVRARGILAGLAAVCASAFVVLAPTPAMATLSGPCTAQVNGVDITAGHETAGTAVDVDYRIEVTYGGESTGGDVSAVTVTLELAGIGLRSHEVLTSGPTWSDSVSIEKYAWAGVGLYLVRGEAVGSGGPVCTGTAYICVTGRSPFVTVAGLVSVGLGALALVLLVRGLFVRGRSSRAGLASRFGLAGVLGGVGVPLLLQQTCTVALTPNLAAASVGGGLVGLAVLGVLIGGARKVVERREPTPPPPPPAPSPRYEDRALVYRFSPPSDACNACKSHAAHRSYRTEEAIAADRAHPGCHCQIVPESRQRREVVALFAGRGDVVDDRGT
jgi:hypothetical protein